MPRHAERSVGGFVTPAEYILKGLLESETRDEAREEIERALAEIRHALW
jgi:hypothetical protein